MNTEEKQLMSRAKALLMDQYQLTEPMAHRFIYKTAMDSQQKAVVIAQRVIEAFIREHI